MWKEYPKSKKMYEEAQKIFAMGVGSQVQSFAKPHPLYMTKGEGCRLYDEDGNEFIDYLLNYGPNILGHTSKALQKAITEQLMLGVGFGEPHSLQIELAESLTEIVPGMEVVNYCNTGTEAVQAVLRLARGNTKRTKFIKLEGHYHGWMDNVFLSFHPNKNEDYGTRENPKPVLHGYCEGQPENILDNVISLPWNNLDYVKKAFKEHPGEIACILTEPIMSNCGVIMPRDGYLEGLKAVCEENGALLIFDETITGLRVALGGAQELFDVIPDITCGFKALGGGFPIFAYGASSGIMQIVSDRKAVQAGTFNGNAIGCKAAITVINELRKNDREILKRINEIGKHMTAEIAKSAKKYGETIRIQGVGGLFCVSFMNHDMFDMRDSFDNTNERYFIFRELLLDRGIHIFPTEKGLWYISSEHRNEDVEKTLKIIDEVFSLMKYM